LRHLSLTDMLTWSPLVLHLKSVVRAIGQVDFWRL